MFRQPQGKKLSESSEDLTSAKVVETSVATHTDNSPSP